jgi:Zn finger protein HypA/HybF involved in hydrogenase expression
LHELGIALEICRMAEERLDREASPRLVSLGVEVGDEAGVEPGHLQFCLETLLSAPPFAGARPVISRLRGDDLRVTYFEVEDGRPDD